MASGPITSWQKEWEKVEAVTDFLFLGSKITVVSDCSHEIKKLFILGRKAMANLDKHIKKQRHHFANKDLHSQSYGFSSSHVWMWELDHKVAILSNGGCRRRLLIVPWAERRLNQSILNKINPEYSLEGLMLKQKLQYFGHLMQIANSLDKTLIWERLKEKGEGGDRGWDGIIHSMGMNLSKLWEIVKDRSLACSSSWGCKESDMT